MELLDVRLRILKRIAQIGECKKYHIKFETEYLPSLKDYSTDITVFTGTGEDVCIVDSHRKIGLGEEKAVFEWLNGWEEEFRKERENASY